MEVTVTIGSKELSKEELKLLIQSIRDCEQRSFPKKEIRIWIEAPELTAEEFAKILDSTTPPINMGQAYG